MKRTKIVSRILVTLITLQTVMPVYGVTYSEHPQYSDMLAQEMLSRNGYSKTNEDYIFEVDGKKFILLDTDEEGNYFVLTEDLYGKKAFDTSFQPDRNGNNRNGSYTVEKINTNTGECVPVANAFNIDEIKFSTTDTNNIGYWLNNEFLANGNGEGNVLPDAIKENLLITDWSVEGMNGAVMDWTAERYDNEVKLVSTGANKAKEFVIEPFTVTSKLALMSVTEFKAYQDIIGFEHNEDTWKGMMLRTPRIQMFGTTWNDGNVTWEYLKFGWANVMVKNNGTDKATSMNQKMVMVHNDMPHAAEMFVRPCFWLDKDFFKNVACDIENNDIKIGDYPLSMLKRHTYEELHSIYSDDVLIELGYQLPGNDDESSDSDSEDSELPGYIEMEAQEILSRNGYSQTDENYIFKVNGKKFILLDTDEEGNYFVLTEDLYGKKAFDTSFQPDRNGNNRNGSYTVEKINTNTGECVPVANAFNIDEIKFSTTDTNNIGYWLNNEFLINGNGEGNVLPDAIKENLLMTDWSVEGINGAVMDWTAERYDNEVKLVATGANKAKEFVIEPFTVTSKLALMSVTEFKAYQDIIGFEHNEDTWKGMMLRTPRIQMFGTTWNDGNVTWEYLKFGWANVMVKNNGTDKATSMNQKMVMLHNDMPHVAEMFVRPCFWLDKDFFKNVACDVIDDNVDMGSYPLSLLKKHSYLDLKNIYSDTILENLGYEIVNPDPGEDPDPDPGENPDPGEDPDPDPGENPDPGDEPDLELPGYIEMEAQEALSRNGYSKTNEDYIFEVDGKKFILLDKDEEGNYFVLTEDLYGKKAYDTSFQPDTKGNNRNGSYTVEKINTNTGECVSVDHSQFDIDEIKFSITDTNNIGYWLNNEFLIDGNGEGNNLPDAIKENLLMTDWSVEGINGAVMDWTAARYDNEIKQVAAGANKAKEFVIEPFTVTSKLALMSVTEYKTYQDLIGFEHDEETWKGMMLRTPRIQMFGTTFNDGSATWEYLKFGWANVMVKNNGTDKATSMNQKMVMLHNDMPHAAEMFVRPCFWLDKDFFKNVKVNVEATGSIPKAEIMKHSIVTLLNTYTVDEINNMYQNDENSPKVENLKIAGTPTIGSVISAKYDFVSLDSEGESIVYWLVSDTPEGEYTFKGETGINYVVKNEDKNKYIKYLVIPKTEKDISGNIYISEERTSAVADGSTANVKEVVEENGGVTITLSNPLTTKKTARIVVAEYNDKNMLISTNMIDIEEFTGEIQKSVSIPIPQSGNTVSVMIWADSNQPLMVIE